MEKTNGFTKSGGSPPTKPRKLSWQFEDLAFLIQLASRQSAATKLLHVLGKAANDGGCSHHGYASLMARSGIRSTSTMYAAIHYLLQVGIEEVGQPILTRTQGDGKDTSHYKLHLGAMQKLVKHQGIFDFETGKQIRHPKWEQPDGVSVNDTPSEGRGIGEWEEGVSVNDRVGVSVTDGGGIVDTITNPQGTQSLNPKENPLSKAGATEFSSSGFSEVADPDNKGLVVASADGDLKSSKRFTLKRWCPVCNDPVKLGGDNADLGEVVCPRCGDGNNGLMAPRSDADGKRYTELTFSACSVDDRRAWYPTLSVSQRRWIAMSKYAAEFQQWLDENGESK